MKKIILAVVSCLFLCASVVYASPVEVEDGRVVRFDYTLTIDGTVVVTSDGGEPLEYMHGSRMIISGLEEELQGMRVGEAKRITVAPQEAYGEPDPRAVIEVPRADLGVAAEPHPGMMLQLKTTSGQVLPAVIENVSDDTVMLNFNHPLAGKELIFDVKVVDIQ